MSGKPEPRAVILGCADRALDEGERRLFADVDPAGFILFKRNCESPGQLRDLVAALRDSVGRPDAPVLIDQEGGRVVRLRPPHWRAPPAPALFGALARADLARARRAVWLNERLIAAELFDVGVDVNCAPALDLRFAGATDMVGDRAFSDDIETVAALGRAAADGISDGGVLPVVKHLPGHGRARADSHVSLPHVDEPLAELRARDFAPFHALRDVPLGITAHVRYDALDNARPATLSPTVIEQAIRGEIGFQGLLLTDDLSMGALSGPVEARAAAALAAGCDIALHCNGKRDEMEAVAAAVPRLQGASAARWARALAARRPPAAFDAAEATRELDGLLAGLVAA